MSTIKTTLSTSFLLAVGLSMPVLSYADEKKPMEMPVDCVTAAEIEAMTEEQKAKLTLPVCLKEAVEGVIEEPAPKK